MGKEKDMVDPTIFGIVGLSITLLIIALYLTDKVKYFSKARAMTAPAFALTIIPAFYTVFGTSYQIDLMASEGVSQWWYYAVSWYVAYALGIVLGGMIRSTGNHLTLPDRFAKYGAGSEFLSSVVSFLYLMPLDVMLMLGVMGTLLVSDVPFEMLVLVLGVFLIAYTALKGWSGYSIAGILYFVFMALGIGVTSIMLVEVAGGWGTIASTVNPNMLQPWFTDFSGFLKGLSNPATLIWFLMGFSFIIDPMVWQRFSLTESDRAVRRGMVYAIIFWVIFDLATVFSGLAVASLGIGGYLDTALTLPSMWAGLIIAGNLMVALAGGSAYLHAGGMIFSQNLAKSFGLVRPDTLSSSKVAEKWYQIGVFLLGGMTILITLILNVLIPEAPTTMAWLIVSGLLVGGLMWSLIFGGLLFREKIEKGRWYQRIVVPKEAVKYSILFGLSTTLVLMIYGLLFPTATSVLTLGITPQTASGTPYVDASRVIGLLASIVGWIFGYVLHIIKRGG